MDIELGAMAPKLSQQLSSLRRLDQDKVAMAEKDADAITRLHVRGILIESEATRARNRLMKKIIKLIYQSGYR